MQLQFHHEQLGIQNSLYALITNVHIHSQNPTLEIYKNQALEQILNYSDDFIQNYEVNTGYRELLKKFDKKHLKPASQNFVEIIRKRTRFPTINTAVDAYNIVAAKSFLSIGAHDMDTIKGDIVFDYARNGEQIPAVNMKDAFLVDEGDYVYRDSEKILAWLDIRDSDIAKLTKETKNILLIIEGNANTTENYIFKYLKESAQLITQFCGGNFEIRKVSTNQTLEKNY